MAENTKALEKMTRNSYFVLAAAKLGIVKLFHNSKLSIKKL